MLTSPLSHFSDIGAPELLPFSLSKSCTHNISRCHVYILLCWPMRSCAYSFRRISLPRSRAFALIHFYTLPFRPSHYQKSCTFLEALYFAHTYSLYDVPRAHKIQCFSLSRYAGLPESAIPRMCESI